MGVWGAGNFENDIANDMIYELCEPLFVQIQRTMSDERLMEPDEPDSTEMFVNMEVLIRLADIYGFGYFLEDGNEKGANEIAEWKAKYLEVWDGHIDKLQPKPDHKRDRRLAIIDTFDRFEQAVCKAVNLPDDD